MMIITVGIDIGSQSTKVVLGSAHNCEIVRNVVGGHTTPTTVAFQGSQRHMGVASSSKTAVTHLNRLLDGESSDKVDPFVPFYKFDFDHGVVTNVDYSGLDEISSSSISFSSTALLGMLLGEIHAHVQSTMKRLTGKDTADPMEDSSWEYRYVLTMGPDTTATAQAQFLEAAYIAGIANKAHLVNQSLTYAHAYQRKFPEHEDKTILLVDMGETQTTVAVYQTAFKTTTTSSSNGDDGKMENEEPQETPLSLLSAIRCKTLGAAVVDIALWNHFVQTVDALKDVTPKSKPGQRLLVACQKLKHLLSQLPQASVTVENINDRDVSLSATRDVLQETCGPTMETTLQTMIQQALTQANVETIDSLFAIEVAGGGCRIPMVQQAIRDAVHGIATTTMTTTEDDNHPNMMTLSHSLDDTSAALGAALMGEDDTIMSRYEGTGYVVTADQVLDMDEESQQRRDHLCQQEQAMAAKDQEVQQRANTMNRIEAHVLELQSAQHGTHGSLLPTTELQDYLRQVEDWLFSEQADAATKDEMERKWQEVQSTTSELCKDYFAAVQQDKLAKEAEMEAEAKQAQLERNDGEEQQEDHDTRRLPKKRRMEIVMKNKAEANELFSDGNFKFAAARYTKALTHCSKFVDLTPTDVEEVNSVKLSLNLNLALTYLKLDNPNQALRVCNDALAVDGSHTKALYRRASVYYEKKQWDLARQDVQKALVGAPENDKAIHKLSERIDAQIKRQKAKEKKMAQKMFG